MDAGLIRDYLAEFSKRQPAGKPVPRQLEVALKEKFIISTVGPRRAGKTFYFLQLIDRVGKRDSLYLNFEDTRLLDTDFREIRALLRIFAELFGKYPKYIFLDEIQNVKRWESAVRELYDTFKYRIFVTGSSSKLLSKEISTQLRGRSLTYMFLPFSFSEFLESRSFRAEGLTKDEESLLKHLLKEYLEFGGFPDVALSEAKDKILKDYFDAILFKDVVERHNVRNLHLVNLIFKQMIGNFSKEFSVNAMYNNFKSQGVKASKDTIYRYLNFFEDSVSVFFLKRHSEKIRVKESWPRKVYLSDTGLSRVLKSSEDLGKLMENCVFLQLLRLKNDRPLMEIAYYKDSSGKEVDFVVKDGDEIEQLIQVTYASGFADVRKEEMANLADASKYLKCGNLKVVTWDCEGQKNVDGHPVEFIPLWKWLLGAAKERQK
ncbi:ATP-binding protein [Candidatus Woesearchaeota archaeon]|nr:ATP-binding protein [Candidatus Woesearchaeota archaeon]